MQTAQYAITRPSVCLSVCPSVTRVDQSETVEVRTGALKMQKWKKQEWKSRERKAQMMKSRNKRKSNRTQSTCLPHIKAVLRPTIWAEQVFFVIITAKTQKPSVSKCTCIQDSWAIAKKTARCAQYMGALKIFESSLRTQLLIRKFVTDFCSDQY